MLYKYVKWLTSTINSSLAEITDTVHQEKPNLPVYAIFPLDPVVEWFTGASMHLGFDIDLIARTINGLLINMMPWTPMYPSKGSSDWDQLARRIALIRERHPKLLISLMLGNLDAEWDTEWFETLAQAAGVTKIFCSMTNSRLFNIKK